jgi:hypothetical protein
VHAGNDMETGDNVIVEHYVHVDIPMLTYNMHYAIILLNSLDLFMYAWNGRHAYVRDLVDL